MDTKHPNEPDERRDQRLGIMLTPSEYAQVRHIARTESRSISSAARLLLLQALGDWQQCWHERGKPRS